MLVILYGMTPVVAGAIFLAALIANAFADLGVGIWLDRCPHHGPALAASSLLASAASFPATMLVAPYGAGAVLAAMLGRIDIQDSQAPRCVIHEAPC